MITNRENVIIHMGPPELVRAFRNEFDAMWQMYHRNTKIPAAA